MDTLGYIYEEVDINDKILSPHEWKVVFFESIFGFHFFRQTENGFWYQKKGFWELPTYLDENMNVIMDPIDYMKNTSPINCYRKMEYQKTYRLRRSK